MTTTATATRSTVRDLVLEFPQAASILEQLKIDYCCGGNKLLTDACEIAGVEVDEVLRLVTASDTKFEPAPGKDATLTVLIDHILNKHHAFTKSEMVRLMGLFEKVLAAHGENHPDLEQADNLFTILCDDLKQHIFKEEEILFPYMIKLEKASWNNRRLPDAPFGTVNDPVRTMMLEHDVAGELFRDLRELTSNYVVPVGGCMSFKVLYQGLEAFEKDLHQHIHLENNILFPKAIELEARLSGKSFSM